MEGLLGRLSDLSIDLGASGYLAVSGLTLIFQFVSDLHALSLVPFFGIVGKTTCIATD